MVPNHRPNAVVPPVKGNMSFGSDILTMGYLMIGLMMGSLIMSSLMMGSLMMGSCSLMMGSLMMGSDYLVLPRILIYYNSHKITLYESKTGI
jgi:hypothetical protein